MGPPPDKAEGGGGEGAATSVRNVFSTSEFSKGPLSRFGDVFPLPIPVDDGFAGCVSGLASRRSRQRVHRRRTLMDRERGTVWALNHLAGFSDASTWPLSHLNAAQRHINSRIRRAHKERAPPAVQESPQAALRQLLRKKAGTYSSDQPGQLASYVRERLSLPKGQGEPVRLTEILPPRERHQLENFAAEMMLGDEEIAGVLERGLDGLRHIDPVLAHNPRRYHEFVADLYDCKLVGFTVTPKVQVGAFVVTKKGDRQRLIVDARRTNRLFRTPPSTNLGSIESWARLECNPGETLFMAQEDVKDFFYRLRIDQKVGGVLCAPDGRSLHAAGVSGLHAGGASGTRRQARRTLLSFLDRVADGLQLGLSSCASGTHGGGSSRAAGEPAGQGPEASSSYGSCRWGVSVGYAHIRGQ